jgi:hypothetical protein
MDDKLTLKHSDKIVEKAKQYAKNNNISLSRMIENYLEAITIKKCEKMDISPLVESLTGIIELEDKEYKKDYTDFLSKKYL